MNKAGFDSSLATATVIIALAMAAAGFASIYVSG